MGIKIWVSKIGLEVEVEFAALSPAMQAGVVQYGLKQLLNDKTAGKDLSTEEATAAVLKCHDALKAGTYGFGAGGGKRADAMEVECQRIIADALAKKPGFTLTKARDVSKAWRKSASPELVGKVEKAAKAAIAARALEIDL